MESGAKVRDNNRNAAGVTSTDHAPNQPIAKEATGVADSDHITTQGKSPAFQFYPSNFVSGTADLSTEEVGAYWLLLCWQWEKGSVPADLTAQARIARLTRSRMSTAWTRIARYFTPSEDGSLINPRLERERDKQAEFRRRQSDNGRHGGRPRKPTDNPALTQKKGLGFSGVTQTEPRKSSSVFDLRSSSSDFRQAAAPADARSKRPVYTSDRLAVFEWQLEDLSKMLGAHFEAFDLHAFFDGLSQQSRQSGLVIPKAEAWDWLQAQVLAEVKRRGLPVASAEPVRDRAAEQRAQDERILAEIQQERIARAGR